jgi:hypothetical protein
MCAPQATFDLKDIENGVIFPGKLRQTIAHDREIVNLACNPRRPINDTKVSNGRI